VDPLVARTRPWVVDLAPGAEENPLAVDFAGWIRANLERGVGLTDFAALRATILLVAADIGESFTLRFDLGRLTVHDGAVGVPTVSFCGTTDELRSLSTVPLSARLRVPQLSPLRPGGRATWSLLAKLLAAEFTVYGLVAHPRTVLSERKTAKSP
jgi:hypothetical protein